MLLRRGVHHTRRRVSDAHAEERPHLSGVFGRWAAGGFSDSLAMEVAPFGVKICTLEPGGIRTNWARRAGQNAPDLLPDYEASVGSMLKMLRSLVGISRRQPRQIADLIVQLANSDEVPVRLILGVDAE